MSRKVQANHLHINTVHNQIKLGYLAYFRNMAPQRMFFIKLLYPQFTANCKQEVCGFAGWYDCGAAATATATPANRLETSDLPLTLYLAVFNGSRKVCGRGLNYPQVCNMADV